MFEPVISPDSSEREKGAGAGDFLRIDEPSERLRLDGLFEPSVLGAVIGLHDAVLARRRHPADVEAVDADAEFEQRVGDVAGQDGERALRRAIGGDERLPAMGRHRLDVDDRAGDLLPPHDPHRLLDEKERRAHVDVENLVIALLGGVEDVAPVGQRGGVDERIDAAKALVRLGDNLAAIGDAAEIGFDEHGRTAGRGNVTCNPFAPLRVAAADDYSGGAALGEQSRDGLAESLRAAGDDGDLAVEICRPSIGWARGRGGLGAGVLAMSVSPWG